MSEKVAWYCQDCGRQECPPQKRARPCPHCGRKMQRCSRYEWFLFDELDRLLALRGRGYRIQAQYPLPDHRGHDWYFDIYVWVEGQSIYGGYGELIEVNGPDHEQQKRYSGAGGGYTRDYDKNWEVISNHKLHRQGIETRTVLNEECARRGNAVHRTATKIVDELIHRADNWC